MPDIEPRIPQDDDDADLPRIPDAVITFDGQRVDLRTDVWTLRAHADGGDEVRLNWNTLGAIGARTLLITKLVIADRLTTKAARTVDNDLDACKRLTRWLAENCGTTMVWAALSEETLRGFLEHGKTTPDAGNDFSRIRQIYAWGVRHRLPDFDPALLRKLRAVRAPGNLKGKAVRSQDPVEGPLFRDEVDLIVRALETKRIGREDKTVVMLLLELGTNSNQIARLRNEHLVRFEGELGGVAHIEYQLRVPRNKKRRATTETKLRPVSPELGALLSSLRRGSPSDPLLYWLGTTHPQRQIREALERFVRRSAIVSPRTGQPLLLTPRRFRYTLATDAAEHGASDHHLAELLDHTDTQHVGVYRKTLPTIADRMKVALDPAIAPLVKRFAGIVVDPDGAYPFKDLPKAVVPGNVFFLPDYPNDIGGIGWCGLDVQAHGICKKSPALTCYTCPKFAAWRSGPHQRVLAGLDQSIAAMERRADRRIPLEVVESRVAVQQCVEQIEAETAESGVRRHDGDTRS
jgi:integrase